ncbi:MAG: ATP-binding protein, partial [Thermoanaerobaculia bacterium]
VLGFRGSDRDVTRRKRLEEEVRNAHRMKGIGQLGGGFAHHFNNLLAVIIGRVDIALRQPEADASDSDLQAIRQAAQRGALLTRQLLTFAGKQGATRRVVNLNALIDGARTTLGRLLGDDIALVTQLSTGLWSVAADAVQLEGVLMNLAVNAEEAMPRGGTLTIATANVSAGEHTTLAADIGAGEYVLIALSDTGPGIADDIAHQIFEPFVSTKEWGSNTTGLGLSTLRCRGPAGGAHPARHTAESGQHLSDLPAAIPPADMTGACCRLTGLTPGEVDGTPLSRLAC